MKRLLIRLLLVVVLCIMSVGAASKAEQGGFKIESQHRVCKHDSECISVVLECSCSCGKPVNKKFVELYLEEKETRCRGYSGPMCKMSCPRFVRCISGACEVKRELERPS